jgi:hypothetical protein
MRGEAAAMSIYQPEAVTHSTGGRAPLRIRQVLDEGGGLIVEGTLTTQERIASAKNDLLWIRINLGGSRVDLYSRLEKDAALAGGEVRFRTVPQKFSDPLAKALRAAQGVPIANAGFEIIPLLSSPCDLYSLAVLAARTLLVNQTNSLPVALDELLSLARQVALEHDPAVGLGLRLQSVFDRDPRWIQTLGPHRLVSEPVNEAEAFDLVPPDLWFDVLALIVQMLPGIGPDSLCVDYGDAMPGAVHKVFAAPRDRLESLLVRSRSLIVIDWRFNREIHAVIRKLQTGLR